MEKKQKKSQKMNLLTAMEQIIILSEESQLSSSFFDAAAKEIKYVSKKLGLTPMQSVLMSLFVDNYNDNRIGYRDLCSHLKCRSITIMRHEADFIELEKRELIRCRRDGSCITFRVPPEVITDFKNNKPHVPHEYSGLTFKEFFKELNDIFYMLDNEELMYDFAVEKVQNLLSKNAHLNFVHETQKLSCNEQEMMIFLAFAHNLINKNNDSIMFNNLSMVFEEEYISETVEQEFSEKIHTLFRLNLIELKCHNPLIDYEYYHMTNAAKAKFFPELKFNFEPIELDNDDLLKPEEITKKTLYYDIKTKEQVDTLAQLLSEENYSNIRTRLKEAGMRSGFTCLFYGSPGTGKTESVLQLARKTGRSIMQVDLSALKGSFVGESEKNVKTVFNRYRDVVSECKLTPILLFNEADGIFGNRMENIKSSVDKMENTIQNIILEEMENFEGILIATTNLTQNLDKAFERRFLYKVEFGKPSIEARKSIWKEKIPSLDDTCIEHLAYKYDFSGGQIENIARHYTIDIVLYGHDNSLDRLIQHCDNEKGYNTGGKKVGF